MEILESVASSRGEFVYDKANPIATFLKKDIILVLRYLGFESEVVTRRLKSCVNKFYGFVNLKVIFQSTCRIKSFFPYKDRLCKPQKSKVVCKASCWDCNEFYIGKTKRRLRDRKKDHFKAISGISHNIKWDHFQVLANSSSDLHCKIKKTLLIRDLKPALNENFGSEICGFIKRLVFTAIYLSYYFYLILISYQSS